MVKTPPCSKYEPPKNVQYTKNGRKFCRVNTKKNTKGPQIPPCDKYGSNYILYTKNKKKFCRKTTKKNKLTKTKSRFVDKDCQNINNNKLKKIANILNINLSNYNDSDWICNSLKQLFNTSRPNIEGIRYLSQVLKISSKKKTGSELSREITEKIFKINKNLGDIINIIKGNNKLNNSEFNNLTVNILLSSLYPNNFPYKSPIPITDEFYSELIDKKKNNRPMTEEEKGLLDNSLYIKLCYCTKKMFLKSKFVKDVFNKEENINNYAICTNSIYKQRGLNPPNSAIRNCSKNFKWLKKNDYIKKQKGGGNIGSTPPNKEIIQNNNTNSCFNNFEKQPVTNWPNRFACPSNKCNNWAGGKKY
jgi:hypothetical protein